MSEACWRGYSERCEWKKNTFLPTLRKLEWKKSTVLPTLWKWAQIIETLEWHGRTAIQTLESSERKIKVSPQSCDFGGKVGVFSIFCEWE